MVALALHYDFRAPSFGPPPKEIYQAALDQCEWADAHGFDRVVISSHHGCDDNYGPAPLVAAAAIAARTKTMRIAPVVALPLYDPLHVAEEVAVLDHISGGRIDLIVAAGYRPPEFAMFGVPMWERADRMEEGLRAIRDAWTGEPFTFRGRTVQVTPRPLQRQNPPLIVGGDSRAAARRAASLGDGYAPMTGGESYEWYVEACAQLGRQPSPRPSQQAWMFLHVTEDPERVWPLVAPHLHHVNNSYAQWMAEAGTSMTYEPHDDLDSLRADPRFQVIRPEECIALARECNYLYLDPLFGGISPALAWESLDLVGVRVMPELGRTGSLASLGSEQETRPFERSAD